MQSPIRRPRRIRARPGSSHPDALPRDEGGLHMSVRELLDQLAGHRDASSARRRRRDAARTHVDPHDPHPAAPPTRRRIWTNTHSHPLNHGELQHVLPEHCHQRNEPQRRQ